MRDAVSWGLLAMLGCALTVACGNSEAGGATSAGGTTGAGSGGAAGAAGSPASGGSSGAAAAIDGVTIELLAAVGYNPWLQKNQSLCVYGFIVDSQVMDVRCSSTMLGNNCRVVDCRNSKYGTQPTVPPDITLGTMTCESASSKQVVESPYVSGKHIGPDWKPGEAIKITTTGGTVAPFEVSVVIPEEPLVILEPALATLPDYEVAIDTTKPVVFKWKPTDQQVGIKIYQVELFSLPKSGVQVECTFDGTAGGATIPPELFEHFVSDPTHSRQSGVWAFHTAFKNSTASGYPVQAWGGSWIDTPVTIP